MATQILPTFPDSPQTVYQVELDGDTYTITDRYCLRCLAWYVDVETSDGVILIQGRRISPGADPLSGLVGDDLPPGLFAVLGSDPYRRSDYGADVQLTYVPVAEVPAADALPTYTVT